MSTDASRPALHLRLVSSEPAPPPASDPRVERIAQFFETLQASDLEHLDQIYHPQAFFKDPFNAVQGSAAIGRIFAHMFATLDHPRFVILDRVASGDTAFLTWDFHFQRSGKPMTIHGASQLRLDAQGRISLHRDYWDAAEELYEKLPLLGALLRWLKRRLRVD